MKFWNEEVEDQFLLSFFSPFSSNSTSSNSSYQKNDLSSTPNSPRIFKGVWGRVRQALRDNYGEATDRNWFAKLEVFEDQDKSELRLKAPSDFVKDWIESNYFEDIEKVIKSQRYKVRFC